MNERDFGKGALPIRLNKVRRLFRPKAHKICAVTPFNWQDGYDVEKVVGVIKTKNQNGSLSCGGQAGAYFMQVQSLLKKIPLINSEMSAKSIYSPYHQQGGGMSSLSLSYGLSSQGCAREEQVPSYMETPTGDSPKENK